jgi:bleomycin hydrolase
MKSATKFIGILLVASLWLPVLTQAQENGFKFTTVNDIKTTPVKNQMRTGTCWSFATTSFIETELLRMKKGEYDLSEMYFARYCYEDKADRYVRRTGTANFGAGGQAHDVMNVVRKYGFVTDTAYTGMKSEYTFTKGDPDRKLKKYLDVVMKKKNDTISSVWKDSLNIYLDTYLGKLPSKIVIKDNALDPVAFAKSTGFNPDNYVEITSYSHVPFYKRVMIDIQDNWSQDLYYNLPIDEMMEVIKSALKKGYSVCWDGDVSERGFSHRNGVAIAPETNVKLLESADRTKWESIPDKEWMAKLYAFTGPVPERNITQEKRQKSFDQQQTTDDHLMHFTGMVTDQNGTIYFKTKNSWSATSNKSGGYLNMSEAYVRLNTIAILVHKNAIPRAISSKLGL